MDLENWRQQIDRIDQQIVELLGRRFKVTTEIGRYKAALSMAIRDEARFQELVQKLQIQARSEGVSEELVAKIYHEIHEAAIAKQENL